MNKPKKRLAVVRGTGIHNLQYWVVRCDDSGPDLVNQFGHGWIVDPEQEKYGARRELWVTVLGIKLKPGEWDYLKVETEQ